MRLVHVYPTEAEGVVRLRAEAVRTEQGDQIEAVVLHRSHGLPRREAIGGRLKPAAVGEHVAERHLDGQRRRRKALVGA